MLHDHVPVTIFICKKVLFLCDEIMNTFIFIFTLIYILWFKINEYKLLVQEQKYNSKI